MITEFIKACAQGNISKIKKIILKDPNIVNTQKKDGGRIRNASVGERERIVVELRLDPAL